MIEQVPTTPATSEPVTRPEARLHCHITDTEQDSVVDALITAAREYCERTTSRQFVNATWKEYFDSFPADEIRLGRWPLSTVNSIKYVDADGNTQTWTDTLYEYDTNAEPPRIKPAYNQSWPTIRSGIYNAVTVEFVAGYGATAASVPKHFKQAIMLLVGHWYEHREAYVDRDVPKEVVHALLGMDRVRTFA
jgi:uncharacterized phiE125 gp8 family phage protein